MSLLAGCATVPSQPQSARRLGPPRSASPGSSAAPAGGTCAWAPVPAGEADVKNVGTPPASVRGAGKAVMTLTTSLGTVEITMDAKATPCTVASFAYLAGKKFFDGGPCHRLTTQNLFVLQCGDPSGTGRGGPAYQYGEENLGAAAGYPRGSVAMARKQEPGTNGSQFFINYKDNPLLPADYTPFGTVTKGMDVIDEVAAGGVGEQTNGPGDGTPKTGVVLRQVTVVYS
ncbi:peptidylprolyl isomerase [Dactylosporangium aurantiacum]|uniref:Peptidyl-prolyl cis-trans isomerase n=2 Tax=Dactylosporangium aurantiacum TaxID=35754 RepID=A0A9Q9ITN7_9ACTN|nr:peptidylprolyl isomerase [Dactylosporangium aurantiacum]